MGHPGAPHILFEFSDSVAAVRADLAPTYIFFELCDSVPALWATVIHTQGGSQKLFGMVLRGSREVLRGSRGGPGGGLVDLRDSENC